MAKVIWEDNATVVLLEYIENARIEYGNSTVKRWQKERKSIEWRLVRYPVSYPIEEMLQERNILYRCCHLMNRRFKIIYYYNETEDTVRVVDIWDTRMDPKTLVKRIR
jgi:hypothetical protein